jgi:hypothetical protein
MGKIVTTGSLPRKALEEASSIVLDKKRHADDVFDMTTKKAKQSSTSSSVNPPNFVYNITLPGEEDVALLSSILSIGHCCSI